MDDIELTDVMSYLDTLSKKLDKILNMQTKIAKTLHLIPVTEKEEREIYVARLKNSAQSAKVAEEVSQFQPVKDEAFCVPGLAVFLQDSPDGYDYFSDILADDLNLKKTGG